MKFLQVAKRISLLLLVNILVMFTIGIIVSLVFRGPVARMGGYQNLFLFCFIWGMGGAFISLLLSRWMAKAMMGVQVIDPNTLDPDEQRLLETVGHLARTAGLSVVPEVGVYNSPEINAFATGPSRSRALVSVSSGLLAQMRQYDIEGVLGHEIAHIANGDMVTMTLIQGVVNAFAMFLARIVAFAISRGSSSRDDNRGGNFFMEWMLINLFQTVFMVFGMIVVNWFSRWREFRADAGGARFAGRDHMLSALKTLKSIHEAGADLAGPRQPAVQALKISGHSGGFLALFASHPPLDERIARLENPTLG
ncbi:MAG TPA: protease HtpX [Candidatus Baltobacteraceae bacterium]|jgi:heat shock protein HtpX|nr:protease HtpX [Candidatus Baltobacteraceae bacterium]